MNYNEESIKGLSGLEHIRHRPSGYIQDTEIDGQLKVISELVDNATDELMTINSNVGLLKILIFVNKDKSSYQVGVIDNGRGIPIGKLVDVFSNTLTSGKFDTSSYNFSAGLYGVGATVSLALSKWFRAISMNNGKIGDVSLNYKNIPDEAIICDNDLGRNGTIVMFEPDPEIFTNIPEFANDYSRLINYITQLSLFAKYQIQLFAFDYEIPNVFRFGSTKEVIETIDALCSSDVPLFDSLTVNKDLYIANYFGITKNWSHRINFAGVNNTNTLMIEGEILLNTNINQVTNQKTKLTFVNNILFDDNGSIHINLLLNFFKHHVSSFIQSKSMKKFFLEQYKLPFWLVLDVKYSAAQFSGFAKTSFKDVSFNQPYQSLLNSVFDQSQFEMVYKALEDHIKLQYDKFSNNDFRPSNSMKGLLAKLNRSNKFNDCNTTDRKIAELFLIEGDSAKSDQDRNSLFQASYTLGGKPFNGLTYPSKIEEAIQNIKKNAVFQDIIRIINITPGSDDLSNLNFGKIFIMADADTHGYHITNIVIGNLYLLCPALINNGHVYVVIPPLYSLNSKNGKPIYLKNSRDLNVTLAHHLYYRCLDIELESNVKSDVLSHEEFTVFCEMVSKIGEEIRKLSVEYTIPAILLEQLALMTNHLNLKHPNVEAMQELLGCEIRYVPAGHILVVSIGSEDIVVPLNQISDMIYSRILPLYREFYYGKIRIYATTKNTDMLKRSPVSIIQLCDIFDTLNNLFTIKRYKGLGSTPSADKATICTNPETRRVFQITNIGDVNEVFNMLGSDPSERKKLMDGKLS